MVRTTMRLLVTTPEGKMLLHMRTWTMDAGTRGRRASRTQEAKGYSVAATFDSPADEHYYGLGQQQKGWMDLRDHEIRCWHDYGGDWRRGRVRAVHGLKPRLRAGVG